MGQARIAGPIILHCRFTDRIRKSLRRPTNLLCTTSSFFCAYFNVALEQYRTILQKTLKEYIIILIIFWALSDCGWPDASSGILKYKSLEYLSAIKFWCANICLKPVLFLRWTLKIVQAKICIKAWIFLIGYSSAFSLSLSLYSIILFLRRTHKLLTQTHQRHPCMRQGGLALSTIFPQVLLPKLATNAQPVLQTKTGEQNCKTTSVFYSIQLYSFNKNGPPSLFRSKRHSCRFEDYYLEKRCQLWSIASTTASRKMVQLAEKYCALSKELYCQTVLAYTRWQRSWELRLPRSQVTVLYYSQTFTMPPHCPFHDTFSNITWWCQVAEISGSVAEAVEPPSELRLMSELRYWLLRKSLRWWNRLFNVF